MNRCIQTHVSRCNGLIEKDLSTHHWFWTEKSLGEEMLRHALCPGEHSQVVFPYKGWWHLKREVGLESWIWTMARGYEDTTHRMIEVIGSEARSYILSWRGKTGLVRTATRRSTHLLVSGEMWEESTTSATTDGNPTPTKMIFIHEGGGMRLMGHWHGRWAKQGSTGIFCTYNKHMTKTLKNENNKTMFETIA